MICIREGGLVRASRFLCSRTVLVRRSVGGLALALKLSDKCKVLFTYNIYKIRKTRNKNDDETWF